MEKRGKRGLFLAEIYDFKNKDENGFKDDYEDNESGLFKGLNDKALNDQNSSPDYRKKIARHRMLIFYRILGVFIVAAVIGAVMYINFKNAVYSDYDIIDRITYPEIATANYLEFNSNVLRYSPDGASAFNMQDEMLWNQTYEMQSPIVDISGDYVGIGDYKGTRIYLMNSRGLRGEIDTTLPLKTFCVSGNGMVAVILEENEVTWIRIYNEEGQVVASDRTTMLKSGYPVSISLSDNGMMMAVSYLKIETGSIVSSVAFYNFGDVGQNEIDNLVSGYNYTGTVVSYVEFMNDRSAFAVGDNKFSIFRGSQKPELVSEIDITDEIKSVFNNEQYIGLVFVEGTSEAVYRLEVYNTSGELVLTKYFDLEYSDIIFSGDRIIIYNNSEWSIFNIDGTEKLKGPFRNTVIEVIPTQSSLRYLLVSGNKTEKIQLK